MEASSPSDDDIHKERISKDIPSAEVYEFKKHRQLFDWDCGLTCIQMILPKSEQIKFKDTNSFYEICDEAGFGQSTWTIDLCYILKKFNINHVYYTRTIGIDPTYSKSKYYREVIDRDRDRVNVKFKNAPSNGITVQKKRVNFETLVNHMGKYGPIIVLTNSSLLFCDHCNKKDLTNHKMGYTGHYVVLAGYDLFKRKVFYKDPANDCHICVLSFEDLDRARLAFGTDEDAILIFNHS